MKKISVLIIIIISLLIWKPILSQAPMGEGYYYFDKCQNQFMIQPDCKTSLWQYDNLARAIFQIFIPIFNNTSIDSSFGFISLKRDSIAMAQEMASEVDLKETKK